MKTPIVIDLAVHYCSCIFRTKLCSYW